MSIRLRRYAVYAEHIVTVAAAAAASYALAHIGGLGKPTFWHGVIFAAIAAGLGTIKISVAHLTVNRATFLRPVQPLDLVPIPAGLPKLGRAHHSRHLVKMRFATYLTASYTTPKSINWGSKVKAWGMLLNDRLGDCTIAGILHAIMCWAANIGEAFAPTDQTALTYYERFDGYQAGKPSTDQGGLLATVLADTKKQGILGHTVIAYTQVDPSNETEIKTAIALTGALYVGVALPIAAQSQGVHWTVTKGADAAPGSWGGHCIILTGYDTHGVDTVTWGQAGRATWDWIKAYMDEAYAVISPDWMTAAGVTPGGLNLQQLEQDLAA